MNKIETIVYGAVRKHPGIKKAVKTIYQGFFDMLPKAKEYSINCIETAEGYFFGFHDVSAISGDEKKLLAHKIPFDGRMPKAGEPMTIGYFDLNEGKIGVFHPVAESFAWNYHKGCRLQWFDENSIIFNTAKNNQLVSSIINLKDGTEKIIPYPIDAIYNKNGKSMATTFCYERLNRCMPGYGYPITDGDLKEGYPQESGLFVINLATGERKLVVSLFRLASEVGFDYKDGYSHFVTHTEFSLDGRYVSFLYRAAPFGEEGKDMHKTWIMVYDLQEDKLITLPTQMSGSHYVWNRKNQLVASCVINGKSCHVLYDMADIDNYKCIAADKVNSDGHQTWLDDEVFVTDTYPDRRRMAKLYKMNVKTDEVELLASLYSPKAFQTKDVYCHIACDLHPRLSPSGKYLCFDSPRTGKRSLCVMKMK